MKEKIERNKLLVDLIDKGQMSFDQVRKEFNFKSKGTVWEIYKRVKYGVRRGDIKTKELSTR